MGCNDTGGGYIGGEPILLLSQENGKWKKSNFLANAISKANTFCSPHCIAGQTDLHVKHFSIAEVNNDSFQDIYVESGGGYRQIYSHFLYMQENGSFEPKIARLTPADLANITKSVLCWYLDKTLISSSHLMSPPSFQ